MFGSKQPELSVVPPVDAVAAAADRRRFPRVALPVFFRAPRLRNVRAPVVDVGAGGLRVFSDEPMEVGTTLELELFLPSGEEVRGMARVAWVGALPPEAAARFDVGFEIFDMDPAARALLDAALNAE